MTQWTPDASRRLEQYLSNVRHSLANAHDVNAADIELDIRSHIDAEFHSAIRPVTLTELEAVLVRLGPPDAWVSSAGESNHAHDRDPFTWTGLVAKLKQNVRNVVGTLWHGPEDWRLPYLAFGLFAMGCLTLPLFGFGLFLIGLSYFLGRATVALAREKGVALGARRWLAYPGVVAVALPVLLAFTMWPLAAMPAAGEYVSHLQHLQRFQEERERGLWKHGPVWKDEQIAEATRVLQLIPFKGDNARAVTGLYAGVGAISAWWMLLGLWMYASPAWPKAIFFPLLNHCESRHGMRLAGAMGLILIVWLGVLYRFTGTII